jgi:hypothetical protein
MKAKISAEFLNIFLPVEGISIVAHRFIEGACAKVTSYP